MKVERIFLDTSLQIQRILDSQDVIRAIDQCLGRENVRAMTSQYVLMEYQRSLLADFAHVHRQFITATSLRDAISWIASGQHSFQTRSLIRCIHIAGLAMGAQSFTSRQMVEDMLSLYLHSILPGRFYHCVTMLPDSIHCDLLKDGVQRVSDGSYTVADHCRKEKASCHLPEFLAEQRPKLQAVADYLSVHPNVIKHQERTEHILADILIDPRAALGQTACWLLGDIIIALHIPSGTALWTLDSDFEALSAALGLQLYTPGSES